VGSDPCGDQWLGNTATSQPAPRRAWHELRAHPGRTDASKNAGGSACTCTGEDTCGVGGRRAQPRRVLACIKWPPCGGSSSSTLKPRHPHLLLPLHVLLARWAEAGARGRRGDRPRMRSSLLPSPGSWRSSTPRPSPRRPQRAPVAARPRGRTRGTRQSSTPLRKQPMKPSVMSAFTTAFLCRLAESSHVPAISLYPASSVPTLTTMVGDHPVPAPLVPLDDAPAAAAATEDDEDEEEGMDEEEDDASVASRSSCTHCRGTCAKSCCGCRQDRKSSPQTARSRKYARSRRQCAGAGTGVQPLPALRRRLGQHQTLQPLRCFHSNRPYIDCGCDCTTDCLSRRLASIGRRPPSCGG